MILLLAWPRLRNGGIHGSGEEDGSDKKSEEEQSHAIPEGDILSTGSHVDDGTVVRQLEQPAKEENKCH